MRFLVVSDIHLYPWVAYSEATPNGPSRLLDQFNSLNQVLEYSSRNSILNLIILGDLFHSRRSIETELLVLSTNYFRGFFPKFQRVIFVAGNHDLTGRNRCFSCSILHEFSNVEVYTEPKMIHIEDKIVSILPWTADSVTKPADLCLAHVEVQDVWFNTTMKETRGFGLSAFKSMFKLSLLGHYHMAQVHDNVVVVGSLNRLSRTDQGQEKRFLDLDLKTLTYKSIPVETFDFPNDISVETTSKSEVVQVDYKKKILSIEEAFQLFLESRNKSHLLQKTLEFWNEAQS